MNDETIVAVFETEEHAAAAVRDLDSAGIPSDAITQHAGTSSSGAATTQTEPVREQGFWAGLFGGEPEHSHDTAVYDRSLQGGSSVVTVRASEQHVQQIFDILERHNPIDIDERAASYGLHQSEGGAHGHSAGSTGTGYATNTNVAGQTAAGSQAAIGQVSSSPETLQLSEETLAVGKRAVNRGTTRIRRYVVETPVEEQVNLRDETVTIERHPVTDGRAVGGADFTDKVIEVTETDEEAVVSKQARVREEVVIRKDVNERTETVRDTVRREDVEITKDAGVAETGSGTSAHMTTTSPYKPAS